MVGEKNEHRFGGVWTETKLSILAKYLNSYTTALKNKSFELLYIDAFAGGGKRTETLPKAPALEQCEEIVTYDGSARIALELENPFSRYLFIDNNVDRINELEHLKQQFADKTIKIVKGDANTVIKETCDGFDWSTNKYRGVIFLDPYGNEVDWATLASISKTQCFDIWFLFPFMGVYRQASHNQSNIEYYKEESLNRIFGTNKWKDDLYVSPPIEDMFGGTHEKERVSLDVIQHWIKDRLTECFTPHVRMYAEANMFTCYFRRKYAKYERQRAV